MIAESLAFAFATTFWIVGAVYDYRLLRIPNRLTLAMNVSAWAYWGFFGWDAFIFSIGGSLVGFSIMLIPYVIGGVGSGDVKIYAGGGAWLAPFLGFVELVPWLVASTLVTSVAQLLIRSRLKAD